jgi:pyruvate,water dikinase
MGTGKEGEWSGPVVMGLEGLDKTDLSLAGGKGANLGELTKIEGIRVPAGFCISTEAFSRVIGKSPRVTELISQLSLLKLEDRGKIGAVSGEIRRLIEEIAIPQDIREEISRRLSGLGEKNAYAVRSSATAEDLPTASFAGQQETYLNIIGKEAIQQHISKCWSSLYTERAVSYRLKNGFDHGSIKLAVIVQRMVSPEVAGILFTADPISSNRKLLSIDASFGLGESMVSGLVNPDIYKVVEGKIVDKKISDKKLAIYALSAGGTETKGVEPELRDGQALTDEQILLLARMGRKIETHFGCPQDIEWCWAADGYYIVQSRPITTLYPIPEANDRENHVYVSVGHQQMMTDPMKPLGLSVWQLTASRPMHIAGARLFVDITPQLATPGGRKFVIDALGKSDPLIRDALSTIVQREGYIQPAPDNPGVVPSWATQAPIENDPAIVTDLIHRSQASIASLRQNIQKKSGAEVFDCILEDIRQQKKALSDPNNMGVIMTAMNASSWINEKMQEWLGVTNAADTLSQSTPNNITSEMGLALLDVADVIRPYPKVIDYLQQVASDNFLAELVKLDGGREARNAITAYLDKYGMRCAGEIDITKTRWSEKPATLIPAILGNIRNFLPHAGKQKFEEGRQAALQKEQELSDRLKLLPDGEQKILETKAKISLLRNYIGYREYPKYRMVCRYFIYKQALLQEAERLLQAGVIHEKEDSYFLTFEEFRELVRTNQLDYRIIGNRKIEFAFFEKLAPPRVMTSDGEIVAGKYNRDNLPAGALPGLAVSSGIIEGRARVILRLEDTDLVEGDILVTAYTDPGWTALFVSIKGLVTEVGGLMTHGAVIAREYGLPTVVGVENATKLIKDGQRIRVNGTEGYVEFL